MSYATSEYASPYEEPVQKTSRKTKRLSAGRLSISSMKDIAVSPLVLYKSVKQSTENPRLKAIKSNLKKEQITSKHISNLNFTLFKKLVIPSEIHLDLCLEIWKCVISDVLNLNQIIPLLGHIPELDDFAFKLITNSFKIQFNESRKWRCVYNNNTSPRDSQFIHHSQLKTLINFMESHKLQFNTLAIEPELDNQILLFAKTANKDSTLKKLLQLSKAIELNNYWIDTSAKELTEIPWISKVTLFKTDIRFFDNRILHHMPQLQRIVVMAYELLSIHTINSATDIMEQQKGSLELLTIEYELLAGINGDKSELCSLLADATNRYPDIKLELLPRLNHKGYHLQIFL
ncbi:unnamed protein product [Ambrosiozyma monospora]|uniref:Unnamed protein product n=1 Tax=Ambrosiozyma monospora TaxID=43982 RepID=A0ACB5TCC9_AMBMO|nr:unnamed protein product [Ambrosiozyma monospora]